MTGMDQLIALSRQYGSDPSMVIAGGGNTSLKEGSTLFVKASGHALDSIGPEGFVEMDRPALDAILDSDLGADPDAREEAFKARILAARLHPELGQRPSVECVLHHLLPARYVVHTHSTVANMLTCSVGAEEAASAIFGDEVVWAPYVDPGYVLARALKERLDAWRGRTGRECPPAVLMDNHGLIVCGETPEEVRERTDAALAKIQARLDAAGDAEAFGPRAPLAPGASRRLVGIIGPALRGLLSEGPSLKVVAFDDSDAALAVAASAKGREVAAAGPLMPDQIVYCHSFPLWFEADAEADAAAVVDALRAAIAAHAEATRFPPRIVVVKGVGVFAAGDDYRSADAARAIYLEMVKTMEGAARLGGIDSLCERDRRFIEDWEVENYRKQVSAAGRRTGRAAGKVAIVTGAAQGFGLGIVRDLVAEGAHVVLADINAKGAAAQAQALAREFGAGMTFSVPVNVSDEASVADALHAVVRRFGGFDCFVANAGVLRAESMKTQPRKDFEFVTSVNYVGYFLCAQAAARILSVQHLARPDAWSDIIQINSKSGLQGSNRNAAYAGGKFGGIGLTQSFAMELVDDGIKVNSICPGNFFDGPLWSDPENGLFAQYLRAGKVEGARTVADVRRFYEEKVPMKRGCEVGDVMKAIYYIMEQDYETGQAIPVTGGQVMLR